MAKQVESELSGKIVNCLNARGHYVWKNHGSAYSLAGLSDITGWTKEGYAISLETKMPGNEIKKLTAAQFRFLYDGCKRIPYGRFGVPTSVEEAKAIVEGDYTGRFVLIPRRRLDIPCDVPREQAWRLVVDSLNEPTAMR